MEGGSLDASQASSAIGANPDGSPIGHEGDHPLLPGVEEGDLPAFVSLSNLGMRVTETPAGCRISRREDRPSRANAIEEGIGAAGPTPMMRDLQDIAPQVPAGGEQGLFGRAFDVSRKQDGDVAVLKSEDERVIVSPGLRLSRRRWRPENGHRDRWISDPEAIALSEVQKGNALALRRAQE
jgi:hypothetical protein